MDILPLLQAHDDAVAALLERCFGPARRQRTASLLREGASRIDTASFVVLDGELLVGAVQCFRLHWRRLDGCIRDLALLGPLVSHPDRRGEGIGLVLMQRATGRLDALGQSAMLIGDEPYYGRFGFSATATGRWRLPGPVDPARLLLRSTQPGFFDAEARVSAAAGCATPCANRAA